MCIAGYSIYVNIDILFRYRTVLTLHHQLAVDTSPRMAPPPSPPPPSATCRHPRTTSTVCPPLSAPPPRPLHLLSPPPPPSVMGRAAVAGTLTEILEFPGNYIFLVVAVLLLTFKRLLLRIYVRQSYYSYQFTTYS